MNFRITFANQAKKSLKTIDTSTKQRIKQAIYELPEGDVIKLQGNKGLYRLRVGSWRVLFSYAATNTKDDTILIERVSLRDKAYREV